MHINSGLLPRSVLLCACSGGRAFLLQKNMERNRMDMEDFRVAVISVIVEDMEAAPALNEILHEFSEFVIGRMGIPYRQKHVSIITLVVDAPHNTISSLSGKIGMLGGVTSKTVYSRINGGNHAQTDENTD